MLNSIRKAEERENRSEWSKAAFIGWQFYLLQPIKGQRSDLKKWLIDFGIIPKESAAIKKTDAQADVKRALANAERVMKAFKRR